MSDFKDFLDKVLAPIRAEGDARTGKEAVLPDIAEQVMPQPIPDDELERRYVEAMNALLEDARKRKAVNVFTDVAAWKLAVVAFQCGPHAAGDILRRFGAHLGTLAEADDAQREADAAKEAGRLPN